MHWPELPGHEVYLVGGAVRDRLLGREVHEHDWVVVGATPQLLLDHGYRQVGRDFPVFLHPESHDEVALARTERKAGSGHRGFEVHAAPDVTLVQDLARRDFTVNAMALARDGRLIDVHGGQADLEARVLRHVTDAFAEDPLRVLRGARFLAQLARWQFDLADETVAFMTTMVGSGELQTLSGERIWRETVLGMAASAPLAFFGALARVGAHPGLFGPLEPARGDAPGWRRVVEPPTSLSAEDRWLAVLADRQLAGTQPLPAHDVDACFERLRAPAELRTRLRLLADHAGTLADPQATLPQALLAALGRLDPWRRPERLQALLLALADSPAVVDGPGLLRDWDQLLAGLANVQGRDFAGPGVSGAAIRTRVEAARLERLQVWQRQRRKESPP